MPSTTVRKAIWGLLAIVVIAGLVIAALPLIASTRIVRYRIAQEMEAWSGYRVTLGDAPEIRVWPTFRGILKNVTLSEWGSDGSAPVIRAERVEIDLSAIAVLMGEVAFSRARFVRPVLRVAPAGQFYAPALPGGGRIVRSVHAARAAISANAAKPDLSTLPSDSFGSVEIDDGRIVASENGHESDIVTGLAGTIDWPALNQAADLQASGIWHGQKVSVDMTLAQPLVLFAGGNSQATFSLKSAPLTASFDGLASISKAGFFDGNAKLAAPSLRHALEWAHAEMAEGAPAGALSVKSKISGNAQRLKLANAEIAIDNVPGIGVIEASFTGKAPALSGTLAFDTLDLGSFLAALTPLAPGGSIDSTFSDRINLDLRLSAAKATAAGIPLTNVAATAQVKEGLSVFDLSDAEAFGGSLQAGFRIDGKPDGHHIELRFLASNVDTGAMAQAAGLKRLQPQAKGTLGFNLKGRGETWRDIMRQAVGSATATLGQGAIAGINLPAFLKRASNGGFFALSEVGGGSLPIDGLDFKADIADGVAKISKAEIRAGKTRITLGGIVPYLGGGLALSGSVQQPDQKSPLAFFVGGSWNEPFIAPMLPAFTPQ